MHGPAQAVFSPASPTLRADALHLVQALQPIVIAGSTSFPLKDPVLVPPHRMILAISSNRHCALACKPCVDMAHGAAPLMGREDMGFGGVDPYPLAFDLITVTCMAHENFHV